MHLTNHSLDGSRDPLSSEVSCSDTQLLEASPIHERPSFCISSEASIQRPFILRTDREDAEFSDLGTDFEIGARSYPGRSKHSSLPLEAICQDLTKIVKILQERLKKMESR
jgi:hypothetical protein